jgi:elongation factor G
VFLRVEPLPRGGGFEFVDQVKGGTIPGQFIPAVEKGVREVLAMAPSPATRWWTCAWWCTTASTTAWTARRSPSRPPAARPSWRCHPRGPADRAGAHRRIEISAPDHAMGDITGDLSAKRGMVTGTGNRPAGTVLVKRPGADVGAGGYQNRLNAMTAGQGRYTIVLSHYEAVPPAVQQQLTSGFKGHDDES